MINHTRTIYVAAEHLINKEGSMEEIERLEIDLEEEVHDLAHIKSVKSTRAKGERDE